MKSRVAIIGFGFMGQMHAHVCQALAQAELVAIVDKFPEAALQVKKLGWAIPVYKTLEDLLKETSVDVIDICLPTDLHKDSVIAAARAGKHVFCEKPLALTEKEGEEMLVEVGKSGVKFQVGHCIRFWPEYQALEKYIRSGSGGKLVSLSLQRRASRPASSREDWVHNNTRSKGAALDMHIHDTDFVLHLLGKPQAVQAIGRWESGAFSHIFSQYHFPDVAVVAEGGWDLPEKWGFQMAFQAVFENSIVEFDSNSTPTLHVTEGHKAKEPLPFERPQVKGSSTGGGNISDLGGYFNELSYFFECLSAGKAPEIATGPQALESLRTVLAEIRSAEDRKPISL